MQNKTFLTCLITFFFILLPNVALAASEHTTESAWTATFAESDSYELSTWGAANVTSGSFTAVTSPNDFGDFTMDAAADHNGDQLFAYDDGSAEGAMGNRNTVAKTAPVIDLVFDDSIMGVGFDMYALDGDVEICGSGSDCVTISYTSRDRDIWVEFTTATTTVTLTCTAAYDTENAIVVEAVYWADNDADDDGYKDPSYASSGTDCDDSNATIYPGAPDTCDGVDNDCDGTAEPDGDSDGFYDCNDCDDADANTYPGAAEEDSLTDCMTDVDGDGYGDDSPATGVTAGNDCDDAVATTYTGAPDTCDGVDNDCDGTAEPDGDSDGFYDCDDCDDADANTFPGAAETDSLTDCMTDVDGDGYGDDTVSGSVVAGNDCNDAVATIYTGATETCDGVDQDCDGALDNGFPNYDGDSEADCVDDDDDNDGDDDATDCDDNDANTFTGAAELDSTFDCMTDVDDDGWGDDMASGDVSPGTDCDDDNLDLNQNDVDSDGFSTCDDDCDDDDATSYPGGTEIAYDGIDQDCSGGDLTDVDGDGYDSTDVGWGTDCDDNDSTVFPDAEEFCDGVDGNCNEVDDNDELDDAGDPLFPDDDSNGWADCLEVDDDGDGMSVYDGDCDDDDPSKHVWDYDEDGITTCDDPADCDDNDDTAFPGNEETEYDGVDNDCNDLTPDDDIDGDGYGSVEAGGDDCDDDDASIYPGATEIPYDTIDQDCTGGDLIDVDGDGFAAEIAGGDDCNDQEFAIRPDTEDSPVDDSTEDGVDQDCDGVDGNDIVVPDDTDVLLVAAGGCSAIPATSPTSGFLLMGLFLLVFRRRCN